MNGNDWHLFALFTSVLTGKPMMLSVEGTQFGGVGVGDPEAIGHWMAEVSVSDLVGFPGSEKPINTVTNGEVSPVDMARLTTFIRIQ